MTGSDRSVKVVGVLFRVEKRYYRSMRWLLLLPLLLLLGCTPTETVPELTEPGRTVVPRGGDQIVLAGDTTPVTEEEDPSALADLKVRLPSDYVPSRAVTLNLDFDETEEQIIVFKKRDDPDDLIRILVVMYDPVRNSWIRAWEGATQATGIRSFSVSTDDMVGDHLQEIVCFGINDAGEQTLDLFRRTPDVLGLGVVFTPILSIAADVNIEIESFERPESYEMMEATTVMSFPVVAERLDPEADNLLDTVKTTYSWDVPRQHYVVSATERVSGEVIQDSRLSDLFAGDENDFEAFLSGPWYRSSAGDQMTILFFGTLDRSVVFYSGQLEQSFIWDHTAKAVYGRGAQLTVTNESIRAFSERISVSASALDQIHVSVVGSRNLDGTYDRLTGTLQSSVLAETTITSLSAIQLAGLYRSDTGVEIVFSSPTFTYRDEDGVRRGGYALYNIGDATVLSLKFIDENLLPVANQDFGVTFSETTDEERVLRTLSLEPGQVRLAGFQADADDSIVFQQSVDVEDETDQ